MSEYMTMKQAFECNNDDIPFVNGGFNDEFKLTKNQLFENYNIDLCDFLSSAFSEKWQVIKAESKVLIAGDYIEGLIRRHPSMNNKTCLIDVKQSLEMFDRNGQIKEWNRTKELREAAKLARDDLAVIVTTSNIKRTRYILETVLENLKPPCQ